jgi:hypothetical protein
VIEEETGLDCIALQGTGSYVGANIAEETKSLLQTPTPGMYGWLALALSFPSVLFVAHFRFIVCLFINPAVVCLLLLD